MGGREGHCRVCAEGRPLPGRVAEVGEGAHGHVQGASGVGCGGGIAKEPDGDTGEEEDSGPVEAVSLWILFCVSLSWQCSARFRVRRSHLEHWLSTVKTTDNTCADQK